MSKKSVDASNHRLMFVCLCAVLGTLIGQELSILATAIKVLNTSDARTSLIVASSIATLLSEVFVLWGGTNLEWCLGSAERDNYVNCGHARTDLIRIYLGIVFEAIAIALTIVLAVLCSGDQPTAVFWNTFGYVTVSVYGLGMNTYTGHNKP